MGINYKYDLDTVGGGWYLYELDIVPAYIAPLKSDVNGEGHHAWGIYDEQDRMSDFRIGIWRWDPKEHGFVDGYIIDETHDKYFGGHLGEEQFKLKDDHRWPCFILDPQVVVGMVMMGRIGDYASIVRGDDKEYFHLSNNDYLADIGFRFELPELSYSLEYMKKHDMPRDHYMEMVHRFVASTKAKRELGIQYGNLGWEYRGDVLQYDRRAKGVSSIPKFIDELVEHGLRKKTS